MAALAVGPHTFEKWRQEIPKWIFKLLRQDDYTDARERVIPHLIEALQEAAKDPAPINQQRCRRYARLVKIMSIYCQDCGGDVFSDHQRLCPAHFVEQVKLGE